MDAAPLLPLWMRALVYGAMLVLSLALWTLLLWAALLLLSVLARQHHMATPMTEAEAWATYG